MSGDDENNWTSTEELDAILDRLGAAIGFALGALTRVEQGGPDAALGLQDFLAARRQAQAHARALPIAPAADGGMDLSRLPASARARLEHLAARLAGSFLGVDRGNVLWKVDGIVNLGNKGDA
jgi:hypothetical protein